MVLAGDVDDGSLGDQPAAGDDHDTVGEQLDLGQNMAGDEHGAAPCREVTEQLANPGNTFGVEPVGGLVEHEHPRLSEQGGRQGKPLPHPQRVPPHGPAAVCGKPDELQRLIGPRQRIAARSAVHAQVVQPAPHRVEPLRVEHGAHLAGWRRQSGVPAAADGGGSRVGSDQTQQHPQGCRLPSTVRTEEAGDRLRRCGEAQRVNRIDTAKSL